MRRAVVTGASSGIGRAVATSLVNRGYEVVGTSRNPHSLSERLAGVELRTLDLMDSDSIRQFTDKIGTIDVLVNNAGESQCGPLEELPIDAVERLFRLNVFGAIQLTQAVLPEMRTQRYGRVVMVGSMLASFPLAYRSSYVATKAAIRGFADAARLELSPFGVWLTTVEPGSINTGISERRAKYIEDMSPYRRDFTTVLAALDRNEAAGFAAERVATTVIKAVESSRPRTLYAVGSRAPVAFTLRRLLPRETVERLTARAHGLSPGIRL